ncbi:hypothetical protein HDE_04085 [Halotydeus destructor]|nr:hypothetical protein HDE_04085 [Halotydeus destructor]
MFPNVLTPSSRLNVCMFLVKGLRVAKEAVAAKGRSQHEVAERLRMKGDDFVIRLKKHPLAYRFQKKHALNIIDYLEHSNFIQSRSQIQNCVYITMYDLKSIKEAIEEVKLDPEYGSYWSSSPRVLDYVVYIIEKRHVCNLQQDFFGTGTIVAKAALALVSSLARRS